MGRHSIINSKGHLIIGSFLLLYACLNLSVIRCFSQDWKTVHDGVEYAEVTKEISGLNVNINLLRLDLSKVKLNVIHANDKAIGMETTSSIARRHNAIAAINGGFFRLDKSQWAGDDVSTLMIGGRLISEPASGRTALLIANLSKITLAGFGRPIGGMELCCIQGKKIPINGIDRERKDNEMILYGPEFGPSTLTGSGGTEIIFKKCKVVCRDVVIDVGRGNNPIPIDGYVLSIGSKPSIEAERVIGVLRATSVSKRPSFHIRFDGVNDTLIYKKEHFSPTEAVAGVPRLIKNGKVDITWQEEKASRSFVETRHPRTAVAKLKDGKFLLITVDGRSESSGGIGLRDLADYLLSLGAVDALNMDGGGSTTMVLDGKVVNHPSDKEGERKIGDAMIVTPRILKRP